MTGCSMEELVRAAGLGSTNEDRLLLIIIGMSSCLGAVVRAPFTSILIVFEMTREFALIPALLVAGILSQALCRWMEPVGFYEKVIEDDGHVLSQVMPPRDFREWERYPVSAIANYQPLVFADLEPATLRDAFERVSYSRLVYQQDRQPPSLILRDEALPALSAGDAVPVHAAPTCRREDSIVKVQHQLVESRHGIVLILDSDDGVVVGLVTLHDLLRAQQQFAAQHAE
jgi:CIC family chloride channel protein